MKASIDFWMGDGADDITKASGIIVIDSKKVFRCSGHINFGKVFKQ